MKAKLLLTIIFLFVVTGCFGLKKYKENEINIYLKENFPDQKYIVSEKYKVDIKTETDGDIWSIEEVWDVSLDDDTNLKFQVYNYRNCGSIGCSNHLYNNYDYIYSTYYLEKYNKSNKLELDILKDDDFGIYIRYNTYANIYYSNNDEFENLKVELKNFQKYLNENTNKKIKLYVDIYRINNENKSDSFKINY